MSDEIKIKKMFIFGAKLFYNAFIFFWCFQMVKVFLIFVQYAETTDLKVLYSILLLISIMAMRFPFADLKYHEFE